MFLVKLEIYHNKIIKCVKIGLSIAIGCATRVSSDQDIFEIRKQAEDVMYREKMHLRPSSSRKAVDTVLGTLYEKDKLSEEHSRVVSELSKKLSIAASYSIQKTRQTETAALLHDVGKIIINNDILMKKSKLTDSEFDAMVGKRLYKEPISLNEAIKELRLNSGKQFDKELVEIFIKDVLKQK